MYKLELKSNGTLEVFRDQRLAYVQDLISAMAVCRTPSITCDGSSSGV